MQTAITSRDEEAHMVVATIPTTEDDVNVNGGHKVRRSEPITSIH